MIYTFIPFAPITHHMDIGWCYNHYMELLPSDDDWACFLDHDAMFTTRNWYQQLNMIVQTYADAGCFAAMTNRIGNPHQVHGYDLSLLEGRENRVKTHFEILDSKHTNHDVKHHREIGKHLYDTLPVAVKTSDLAVIAAYWMFGAFTWRAIWDLRAEPRSSSDPNLPGKRVFVKCLWASASGLYFAALTAGILGLIMALLCAAAFLVGAGGPKQRRRR